jgi:hypothetical protein
MIVCVPGRYREAWNAFAAGLDAQLPATARRLNLGGGRSRGARRFRRGSLFFPLLSGKKGRPGDSLAVFKHGKADLFSYLSEDADTISGRNMWK